PPFGIMGLDPAFEKARRYRQLDGVALAAVEFHAGEPTRVHVVADFGAKAILHARPAVQIHARHLGLFLLPGTNRWERGRNAILRREVARTLKNGRRRSNPARHRGHTGSYARRRGAGANVNAGVVSVRAQQGWNDRVGATDS